MKEGIWSSYTLRAEVVYMVVYGVVMSASDLLGSRVEQVGSKPSVRCFVPVRRVAGTRPRLVVSRKRLLSRQLVCEDGLWSARRLTDY